MTYTMLIIIATQTGTVISPPVAVSVGSYSSLSVCDTEKARLDSIDRDRPAVGAGFTILRQCMRRT